MGFTRLLHIHRGLKSPAPHITSRAGCSPSALNPSEMGRGAQKYPRMTSIGSNWGQPSISPMAHTYPEVNLTDTGPSLQTRKPSLEQSSMHALHTPPLTAQACRCAHRWADTPAPRQSETHTHMCIQASPCVHAHLLRCANVHTHSPESDRRSFRGPIPSVSKDPHCCTPR